MPDITLTQTDPDSPEALTCLRAYYDLLLGTIAGLTPADLILPLPDAAQYRAPGGVFLLAQAGDTALGCVSLRALDATTAEVKRLWVSPAARGTGLGRRLMAAIETRAQGIGYALLKLDSNAALTPAITLYRATGWIDCAPYTSYPADVWLAKPL